MKHGLSCILVCLLCVGCGTNAPSTSQQMDKAAIRNVLDDQVACWNSGDLEGFMKGYWKSEELEFRSGDKVTKGWQATFDRYKKKYQSEGAEMGTLKFLNLVITNESPKATVDGDWHLTMKDGKTPHGSFKLALENKSDGWKIVRDETTSAD